MIRKNNLKLTRPGFARYVRVLICRRPIEIDIPIDIDIDNYHRASVASNGSLQLLANNPKVDPDHEILNIFSFVDKFDQDLNHDSIQYQNLAKFREIAMLLPADPIMTLPYDYQMHEQINIDAAIESAMPTLLSEIADFAERFNNLWVPQ